jgi:hypothetical protein
MRLGKKTLDDRNAFTAGSASFAPEQNIGGQRKDCECDEPEPALKTPVPDSPSLVNFVDRFMKFGLGNCLGDRRRDV